MQRHHLTDLTTTVLFLYRPAQVPGLSRSTWPGPSCKLTQCASVSSTTAQTTVTYPSQNSLSTNCKCARGSLRPLTAQWEGA